MLTRNIIVIGASSGGFEVLKKLVGDLPPDFEASIFIVWHMSPHVHGVLPQVLNRVNTIRAANAYDGEPIEPNRIYVAPPDQHLIIEKNQVRITRGPKENRFRPAVDPLFRSAAFAYDRQVIGVVLSGALDDGTAGLWMIKQRGGLAVVQDPSDAEVRSMPENALHGVAVDHSIPVAKMARLLVRLSREQIAEHPETVPPDDEKLGIEVRIAAEESAFKSGIFKFGKLSPYACPDCHGVLTMFRDGDLIRFRCHTGHAFSADVLLRTISENIENSLYGAMRGIEESIMLLNHLGDHFAETNDKKLAAQYFQKAQESEHRADFVRRAILSHEQLSQDVLRRQTEAADDEQDGKEN